MARGGVRPGAGRKPGSKGAITTFERELFVAEVAKRQRAAWRYARRMEAKGGDPAGPEPSRDDAKAAVAMVVSLLIRCATRGDGRAAIHLDERMHGRVKFEIAHGGIPDSPVEHRVYRATLAGGVVPDVPPTAAQIPQADPEGE